MAKKRPGWRPTTGTAGTGSRRGCRRARENQGESTDRSPSSESHGRRMRRQRQESSRRRSVRSYPGKETVKRMGCRRAGRKERLRATRSRTAGSRAPPRSAPGPRCNTGTARPGTQVSGRDAHTVRTKFDRNARKPDARDAPGARCNDRRPAPLLPRLLGATGPGSASIAPRNAPRAERESRAPDYNQDMPSAQSWGQV